MRAMTRERGAVAPWTQRLSNWWLLWTAPQTTMPIALLEPATRERLRSARALALFYGAVVLMLPIGALTILAYVPNAAVVGSVIVMLIVCITLNRRGRSEMSAGAFALVFMAAMTAILHAGSSVAGGFSFAAVPGIDLMVLGLAPAALVLRRRALLAITALAFGSGVFLYLLEGPSRDVVALEALLNPIQPTNALARLTSYGIILLARPFALLFIVVLVHLVERQTIMETATEVDIAKGLADERHAVIVEQQRQQQQAREQQQWVTEVLIYLTQSIEQPGALGSMPSLPAGVAWARDQQVVTQLGLLQNALRRFRRASLAMRDWDRVLAYWQQLPNDVVSARTAGPLPMSELALAADALSATASGAGAAGGPLGVLGVPTAPNLLAGASTLAGEVYPPAEAAMLALRRFAAFLVREEQDVTGTIQQAINRFGYGESTARIADSYQATKLGGIVTALNWLFNRVQVRPEHLATAGVQAPWDLTPPPGPPPTVPDPTPQPQQAPRPPGPASTPWRSVSPSGELPTTSTEVWRDVLDT